MKRLKIRIALILSASAVVAGVSACSSAPRTIPGTQGYTCPTMAKSITNDKTMIAKDEGPGAETASVQSVMVSMDRQILADQQKLYRKYC
jgi:hypothetical protein